MHTDDLEGLNTTSVGVKLESDLKGGGICDIEAKLSDGGLLIIELKRPAVRFTTLETEGHHPADFIQSLFALS